MIRIIVFIVCFTLFPFSGGATERAGIPAGTQDSSTEGSSFALPKDMPWWERFGNRISQTWNSPTWDLYVPFWTWHNRLAYDRSKTDKYNETPWGVGIGKSMYDEDGDWHALYYMGFQDSHDMYEPIVGYGFQKNWRPSQDSDWRAGAGFTLGVTARQQYGYVPLPLPLPMAGIEYKRMALQAVYIPGTYNNGNVLFCWMRWQLN